MLCDVAVMLRDAAVMYQWWQRCGSVDSDVGSDVVVVADAELMWQ